MAAMLKQVTWRSWAVLAVLLGADVCLGFWLSGNGTVEELLYKWGLLALTVAPLLFMAVYTATGNKWWANDVGSALAVLAFGITWTAWPLAYVFWFLHGMLTVSWLAWIEVSGPALVSLAILRLCYVFARIHRAGNGNDKPEGA
jgi:hypothetical protein